MLECLATEVQQVLAIEPMRVECLPPARTQVSGSSRQLFKEEEGKDNNKDGEGFSNHSHWKLQSMEENLPLYFKKPQEDDGFHV